MNFRLAARIVSLAIGVLAATSASAAGPGVNAVSELDASAEPGRDDLAVTTSITRPVVEARRAGRSGPKFVCPMITAPPASLDTRSKYRTDDMSKSTLDDADSDERDRIVTPIRLAIRALTEMAYADNSDRFEQESHAACVLTTLDRWANARSLSHMRSMDAYLTRDRFMAEIVLALRAASRLAPVSEARRVSYRDWLKPIAIDTIEAYGYRLGPKSRINNHRYWAGLSVAATGSFLNNATFIAWGKRSFEIGACQVDLQGFLPAELTRGRKALEYHLYALRPLAAIVRLAEEDRDPIVSSCLDGLKRLQAQTTAALADTKTFEAVAGSAQILDLSETSYSPGLRIAGLSMILR